METSGLGNVAPSSDVLEEVAELIHEGDDEAAAELLGGEALLDAYGDGLSDFMTIVDLPDPTVWL